MPVGLARRLQFEQLESRRVLASDFGDAPAPYPTLLADDGARHEIDQTATSLYLGAGVDADLDGVPGTVADGDDQFIAPGRDDEDGVIEPARDLLVTLDSVPLVRVRVTNTTWTDAWLYGWIDVNRDGVFENDTERASMLVAAGSLGEVFTLEFPQLPFDGPHGQTFARFRLSTDPAAADPSGVSSDGEVEDYPVSIIKPSVAGPRGGFTKEHFSGQAGIDVPTNAGLGSSLAAIGDVDGDGVNDLAVGAPLDRVDGQFYGSVYIVFMNSDGTARESTKISSELNGGPIFEEGSNFGKSLAAIGDLDGDGIEEVAVGSTDETHRGRLFILFLNAEGEVRHYTVISSGYGGGPLLREGDNFGSAVAAMGDLDGDGIEEIAVGAPGTENPGGGSGSADQGAFYTLFLNPDGTVRQAGRTDRRDVSVPLQSATLDWFGASLASIGDIDGDGISELAVGAPETYDVSSPRAKVIIVFLDQWARARRNIAILSPAELNERDFFGRAVTSIGDLDGDGIHELAIGAPDWSTTGAYYVYSISREEDVVRKVSVYGPQASPLDWNANFGSSLTWLGDLDGDGLAEMVAGAPNSDDGRGAFYVMSARPDTWAPEPLTASRFEPSAGLTNADTVRFLVAFSERVAEVDPADFEVVATTSATVSSVSRVTSTSFAITVSGGDLATFEGEISVRLRDDASIWDSSGNPMTDLSLVTTESYIIENAAPELLSIARHNPLSPVSHHDNLSFRVTFSEPVQGVEASDFVLWGTTATTTAQQISGTVYDVFVSGGDLADILGVVGLDLAPSAAITDLAGNKLEVLEPLIDEAFELVEYATADFGDAPTSYKVEYDEGGAAHYVGGPSGPRLGALRELEVDGSPTSAADGDSDDDGVAFGRLLIGQLDATVTVTVAGGPALLDAWIDFNGDGVWDGARERVFTHYPVATGENVLRLAIPANAVAGTTFARFRLSSPGVPGPNGPAPDGEVEDYAIILEAYYGGGVFGPSVVLASDSDELENPVAIDFDEDGDIDPVSLSSSQNRVIWHEHVGNQMYVPHLISTEASGVREIAVGDLEGDGDLDIVSASFGSGSIDLFINDGDQNFSKRLVAGDATTVSEVRFVDMDGDGDLDVLAAGVGEPAPVAVASIPGFIGWYENSLNSEFHLHVIHSDLRLASVIAAVDIDGDGDLDITGTVRGQILVWFENDANQVFTEHALNGYAEFPHDLEAIDLDLDGDQDLIATIRYNNALNVYCYANDGQDNFTRRLLSRIHFDHLADNAGVLLFRDREGDGDVDILMSHPWGGLAYLVNGGDFTFTVDQLPGDFNEYYGIQMADMDGDGDTDIVTSIGDFIVWRENTFEATLTAPVAEVLQEGTASPLDLVFRIDQPRPSSSTLRFEIWGDAVASHDYFVAGEASFDGRYGTLVIPAGETSAEVSLSIIDDLLLELDEQISIRLIAGTGYTVSDPGLQTWIVRSDEVGGDFGDLPADYQPPVGYSQAGHSQGIPGGPLLGNEWDLESGPNPSTVADGDGRDDDGVTFSPIRVGGVTTPIVIDTRNGPARLDAWIDFDGDGNWGRPGEQIFTSVEVMEGENFLTFDVPTWAVTGATFARFRVSTLGNLGPHGISGDGEVEDYSVSILAQPRTIGAFDVLTQVVAALPPSTASMTPADLDGDGDIDFVVVPAAGGQVTWLERRGLEGFIQHTTSLSASRIRVADMDRDGDLDLATLYAWCENTPDLSFSRVVTTGSHHPSLSGSGDFEVADVDGDGWLDVVAAYRKGAVVLYRSVDGFDFTTQYIAGDGFLSNPVLEDIAVADEDGDGDLDLYVTGSDSFDGYMRLYRNDGVGGFAALSISRDEGQLLIPADLDGDGDLDIIAKRSNRLLLLVKEGDNVYTPKSVYDSNVGAVTATDFDGDGDIDIATAAGSGLKWLRNSGQGSFDVLDIPGATSFVGGLAHGDVDGNGTVDLIGSFNSPSGIRYFSQSLAAILHVPVATMTETADEPVVVRVEVDAPVALPLAVPFQVVGTASLGIDYLLEGADSIDLQSGVVTIPAGSTYVEILVRPLADQLTEITESIILTIPASGSSGQLFILGDPHAGDYGDAPAPYPTGLEEAGPAHIASGPTLGPSRGSGVAGIPAPAADGDPGDDGVSFGAIRIGKADSQITVNVQNTVGPVRLDGWIDFNGDGSWGGPLEQVFKNVELQPGDNILTFATPADAKPGATFARFRVSTSGGLSVTGSADDGEVEDYLVDIGTPASLPINFVAITVGSSQLMRDALPVDFDRDGDVDVVSIDYLGQVNWHEQTEPEVFAAQTVGNIGTFVSMVDLGVEDIDGDGDLDVVVSSNQTGSDRGVLLWFRNDDDQFTLQSIAEPNTGASSFYLADMDADGDIDVLAPTYRRPAFSSPIRELRWFENDGSGAFSPHVVVSNIGNLKSVQAVDLDRDGDLDMLTSESGFGGIVWYENVGDADFVQHRVTVASSGTPPLSDPGMYVHAADLDGDGDLDLLAVSQARSMALQWFEQQVDGSFTPQTVAPGNYFAREVVTADMDGDGDLDVIYAGLYGPKGYVSWAENRLKGDFNDDGIVTTADYLVWKQYYGSSEGVGLRADGNGNGVVDAADFVVWRNALGGAKGERTFVLHYGGVVANAVHSTDIDNDGDLDLLAATSTGLKWLANGPLVTFAMTGSTLHESSSHPIEITLTRDSRVEQDLAIRFEALGAARYSFDYTFDGATDVSEQGGTFVIPAGMTSAAFHLRPLEDDLVELEETLTLRLIPSITFAPATSELAFTLTGDGVGGDFGDAPASFPTLVANDGARHSRRTANDPQLGVTRGEATDAVPSTLANSDTTDDGILIGSWHVGQVGAELTVNVQQAAGILDAWIDFNGNGVWNVPGERVFTNLPLALGDNLLSIDIPATAVVGDVFARFRISTAGGLTPTGMAADGEVEDYVITIAATPPTEASLHLAMATLSVPQVPPISLTSGDSGASKLSPPGWEWSLRSHFISAGHAGLLSSERLRDALLLSEVRESPTSEHPMMNAEPLAWDGPSQRHKYHIVDEAFSLNERTPEHGDGVSGLIAVDHVQRAEEGHWGGWL